MSTGSQKLSNYLLKRRQFLTQTFYSVLGLSAASFANTSCSTLDDYLLEEQTEFDHEVLIVGGGPVGLYCAYQLKKNKIPFKIFESHNRLGGKIQTLQNNEWGCFQFQKGDDLLKKLVTELNLETKTLQNQDWTIHRGAMALIEELTSINQGLIPQRQIKLQHRLKKVVPFGIKGQWNPRTQLHFETPQGDRTFTGKKMIFCLPNASLSKIEGLSEFKPLQEQMQTIHQLNAQPFAYLRVNVPSDLLVSGKKIKNHVNFKNTTNLNEALKTQSEKWGIEASYLIKEQNFVFNMRLPLDHPLRRVDQLQILFQSMLNPEFVFTSDFVKDWAFDENGYDFRMTKASSSSLGKVNTNLANNPKLAVDLDNPYKLITESQVTASEFMFSVKSNLIRSPQSSLEQLFRIAQDELQTFILS